MYSKYTKNIAEYINNRSLYNIKLRCGYCKKKIMHNTYPEYIYCSQLCYNMNNYKEYITSLDSMHELFPYYYEN